MHRLFYIPEILFEVRSSLGPSDLLNFGLSSKALWSIAVEKLWETIELTAAFEGLFAQDLVWSVPPVSPESETPGETLILSRPVSADEWDSVRQYTRHIRNIKLSDDRRFPIHFFERTLFIMSTYDREARLFPKLRSVSLDLGYAVNIRACAFLLAEPARTIKLEIDDIKGKHYPNQTDGLIVQELMKNRVVQDLTLKVCNLPFEVQLEGIPEHQFATLVPHLGQLRSVSIGDVISGRLLLPALAQLPFLEHLNILIETEDGTGQFTLPPGSFPSLQQLICPATHSQYAYLLQSISSQSLFRLMTSCTNAPEARGILQILANKWADTMLDVELIVSDRDEDLPPLDDPFDDPFDVILPLTMCRNLECFSLRYHLPFDFLDHDYEAMANVWPRLTSIVLDTGRDGREWIPKATCATFAMFADKLRMLNRLHVSIDFDRDRPTGNDGDGVRDPAPLSTSLKELGVMYSTCTDPGKAVIFLRSTFPMVEHFSPGSYTILPHHAEQRQAMQQVAEGLGWPDFPVPGLEEMEAMDPDYEPSESEDD